MTNDQLVGLKQLDLVWAVIEGDDVIYFHDADGDPDGHYCARSAADEHAYLTGGRVVRLGIRSEIVHVEELLDGIVPTGIIEGELVDDDEPRYGIIEDEE